MDKVRHSKLWNTGFYDLHSRFYRDDISPGANVLFRWRIKWNDTWVQEQESVFHLTQSDCCVLGGGGGRQMISVKSVLDLRHIISSSLGQLVNHRFLSPPGIKSSDPALFSSAVKCLSCTNPILYWGHYANHQHKLECKKQFAVDRQLGAPKKAVEYIFVYFLHITNIGQK